MTDDPVPVKPVRRSPSTRSGHREQRRAVLVQAAMRAIRQHGPDVAMDDIASEAGVSKPILYRHFLDKGDLYMAVSETATEQLRAVLLSGLSSEVDPRTLLRVVIDAYLTFIESEPELYRFVVRRSFTDRPLPRDPVTTNAALIAGALATIFADQLKRGRKTATIRLGDKSHKYKKNQAVMVTIGYQHSPREKIFDAVIDQVEVKRVRDLTPRDIEHDNPEFRRHEEMIHFLEQIYGKKVTMEDIVTVVRFSQIIVHPPSFTDARLGIGGAQN